MNLRIQNYGLIKYEPFDAVILGTSMLQNMSADEATKKLKHNFVNLSFSGAAYYERFLMLDFTLRTKKIKSAILSLDYHFRTDKITGESFYPELYSQNTLGTKIRIYSTTKAVLCTLLNKSCDFIKKNTDRPTAWTSPLFGGFDNWLKYQKTEKQAQEAFQQLLKTDEKYEEEYEKYKTVINNEILPLFKNNKETSFSIIIPPYSIMYWKKRQDLFEKLMTPYEYLIEKTKNYPNVKIYWFFDEDYVSDISKYKDLGHYDETVNSRQIDAIQNGTHILDETNYKQKIKAFIEKIRAFDLEPYLKRIREEADIKASFPV